MNYVFHPHKWNICIGQFDYFGIHYRPRIYSVSHLVSFTLLRNAFFRSDGLKKFIVVTGPIYYFEVFWMSNVPCKQDYKQEKKYNGA